MRTVTLEEHFTTPEVVKVTKDVRRQPPGLMQDIEAKLQDLGQGRLAAMDEAGVSFQVLSLTDTPLDRLPPDTATALVRDVNDRAAEAVRAHPDRFSAFASLDLRDPQGAARELERAVKTLGFPGAMVNGTVNGLFLDDERFAPFWEAAEALDAPIYLHPAPPPETVETAYYSGLPGPFGYMLAIAGWGWHSETALHTLRLIVSGLFERRPKLKLIIGHMGEGLPYSLARSNQVLGRASQGLLEEKPEFYFRRNVWITTSGFFTPEPFECAKAVLGIDRILFSVDYPYSPNTAGRKFLDGLQLEAGEREALEHGNAERLLKLGA